MTTLNPADLAQLDQATAQCLDKADKLAALYDHLDPAQATLELCGELAAYVVSTGELGSILGAMAALVVDRRRKKINARTETPQ